MLESFPLPLLTPLGVCIGSGKDSSTKIIGFSKQSKLRKRSNRGFMRKKRSLTLIELMIVIVLIGIIASVIGVNMKGSLEEGKAFKTRQAQEKITDVLMLEMAQGAPLDKILSDPAKYLASSGLMKGKKEQLTQDGWGIPFVIVADGKGGVSVTSAKLQTYEAKKRKLRHTDLAAADNEEE